MSPSDLAPIVDPAAEGQAKPLYSRCCRPPRSISAHVPGLGSFLHLIAGVSDPRQPELITYPLAALLVERRTACVRRHLDVCLSLGRSVANRPDVRDTGLPILRLLGFIF